MTCAEGLWQCVAHGIPPTLFLSFTSGTVGAARTVSRLTRASLEDATWAEAASAPAQRSSKPPQDVSACAEDWPVAKRLGDLVQSLRFELYRMKRVEERRAEFHVRDAASTCAVPLAAILLE
eukprot:CAMPEP_0115862868 /NCGR_PEP_ID=MMETSP0287-20121206/18400_1 /TAXON_ID=412157 /ORGANISM="Chrysochromulina rotalis, Strain UIO044" /LENGTH=121 /DNA_ID=CAMNT_0003317307 /DNA_START=276 /DNA_END=642 /DNA_ORIENTATION=+